MPGVALGPREVVGRIEAVAGDGRIHLRGRVIRHQRVAYAAADLALGPVLGDVQSIDCPGDHAVNLGLAIGLSPIVVIGEVDASHCCGYEAVHLSCGAVVSQLGRYEAVYPAVVLYSASAAAMRPSTSAVVLKAASAAAMAASLWAAVS